MWSYRQDQADQVLLSGITARTLVDFSSVASSLVAIPGLSVPLEANKTYEIDALLKCVINNTTNDLRIGFDFSAAGAAVGWVGIGSLGSSLNLIGANSLNNSGGIGIPAATTVKGIIRVTGTVTTGVNPGNFFMLGHSSLGGTWIIFTNSRLSVNEFRSLS